MKFERNRLEELKQHLLLVNISKKFQLSDTDDIISVRKRKNYF